MRSQTHHAIMFGDKQGFINLYCSASGEAVRALVTPGTPATTDAGGGDGDEAFAPDLEVSKAGLEVVMTELESAIFDLLEKLSPTASGPADREMLLEWLAAFQHGCMELDFMGQAHVQAFRILQTFMNAQTVGFEALSESLKEVDGFKAVTSKGSLPDGESNPFLVWLCSHSDGLRLVSAARQALEARAEESKFVQEINGLKVAHDAFLVERRALSDCAPADDATQESLVDSARALLEQCVELGQTFPKGMRKELAQLQNSTATSLSKMARARMQSSLASGLKSIVAASGSKGYLGDGKLLNVQESLTS